MPDSFEVVVVGAGLLGASVARECALRGLEVALVERGEVASGASGVGPLLLAEELPTGGDARTLAGLAFLAPHLVEIVPVESLGLGSIVDVTRLTQLYVLDAIERGAAFFGATPVARIGDARTASTRCVHLEGGDAVEGRSIVVATGAVAPEAEGLAAPTTRSLRVVDVDTPPPEAGRFSDGVVSFPTPDGARLVLPTGDETAVTSALEAHGLSGAPVTASEVHAVAVAGEAREDAAPGLVRVSESSPGAHRDVATYLADAFAKKAGRVTSFDREAVEREAVLPGGETLIAPAPLAARCEVPELAVRALTRRHGSRVPEVLARARRFPRERALLCSCRAILECEVRHVCRKEGAHTLTDVARRTGLGRGPCHGIDCAHRAAQVIREETGGDAAAANDAVFSFLDHGFARRAPFLRAADLAREELLLSRLVRGGLGAGEDER